jgi:Major Facilitator Superfamily
MESKGPLLSMSKVTPGTSVNQIQASQHNKNEDAGDGDDDGTWDIPLPRPPGTSRRNVSTNSHATALHPLIGGAGGKRRRRQDSSSFLNDRLSAWSNRLGESFLTSRDRRVSLLFGDNSDYSINKQSNRNSSTLRRGGNYNDADPPDLDTDTTTTDADTDAACNVVEKTTTTPHKPSGLAGFLFGFMYEEPTNGESFDADDDLYDEQMTSASIYSPLNLALFAAYALAAAAAAIPLVVIPTIGEDLLVSVSNDNDMDTTTTVGQASAFASRAAAKAVFGTACGKFINGPVGDVWGARKTLVTYSMLLSASLLRLASCGNTECAASVCFYIEFFYSVMWPCTIVILATHFRPNNPMYEGGIYITSIASRLGSLVGIPLYYIVLRRTHWRVVCLLGAWVAIIGASVTYLFVTDSPHHINMPQNKLDRHLMQQMASVNVRANPWRFLLILRKCMRSILLDNLVPSFRHVLQSGTFWIVALAHTGSSLVRTSERIMGPYYHDTSMGTLSEDRSGSLAVFLSMGTISGLVIAGSMFAKRCERQRKWLVSRLYIITIFACYCQTVLSIPSLRYMVNSPSLILSFQVMATFAMGFGISVMLYHIPGLVGAAFGHDKGLFLSYTDGVAYGMASIVWRLVGSAVANGDTQGGGWAYGWAAVALMIVLCSILMIEFMEHYFVRGTGRHQGTYETILLA